MMKHLSNGRNYLKSFGIQNILNNFPELDADYLGMRRWEMLNLENSDCFCRFGELLTLNNILWEKWH